MDPRVSHKETQTPEQEKKKRKRKKKTKQTLTHAVTHIRLIEANAGKLSALDHLMAVYQRLSLPASFLRACIGSRYNRRQASPNPGARTVKPPMRPTWKIWLIMQRPKPKPRRRGNHLRRDARNPYGGNGMCPNCASPSCRPTSTWWWSNHQKTPPSTTGSKYRLSTRATRCE